MMTPRERMISTLNHRRPDRVPIMMDCRQEIIEQLCKRFKVSGKNEVAKIFEADMCRYVRVDFRWSEFLQKQQAAPAIKHIDNPTVPAGIIWRDEMTFEDRWGVIERSGSDGKYVEWVDGPFVNTDDIESFCWPKADELVVSDDLARTIAELKKEGYWVLGAGQVHPFKQGWHMRGFENFLCDYIASPEWVEKFYAKMLAYNIPVCQALAAAGVDMIDFWGDVAMQDRMMVPPDAWRSLDKPMWRTLIQETRKINPDIKFFFHSDGNVTEIIDDIIEVGFDILNPIQPECVNPAEIKAKYGDRITLDGGGSVQRTIPRGTIEDVRREVEFLMTTCAYNGGYVFRPSNVIPFDSPIDNVIAFFEFARDFDLSKLSGQPKNIPQPPCMSL